MLLVRAPRWGKGAQGVSTNQSTPRRTGRVHESVHDTPHRAATAGGFTECDACGRVGGLFVSGREQCLSSRGHGCARALPGGNSGEQWRATRGKVPFVRRIFRCIVRWSGLRSTQASAWCVTPIRNLRRLTPLSKIARLVTCSSLAPPKAGDLQALLRGRANSRRPSRLTVNCVPQIPRGGCDDVCGVSFAS